MSKEFRELAKRIFAAKDSEELFQLEKSSTRLYVAGILTVKDLARIDTLIMEKIARWCEA